MGDQIREQQSFRPREFYHFAIVAMSI